MQTEGLGHVSTPPSPTSHLRKVSLIFFLKSLEPDFVEPQNPPTPASPHTLLPCISPQLQLTSQHVKCISLLIVGGEGWLTDHGAIQCSATPCTSASVRRHSGSAVCGPYLSCFIYTCVLLHHTTSYNYRCKRSYLIWPCEGVLWTTWCFLWSHRVRFMSKRFCSSVFLKLHFGK